MKSLRHCICILALLCLASVSHAQKLLQQRVSIQAKDMPLRQFLKEVGKAAHCQFSYNTNILPEDSLINARFQDKTVRQILDAIFGNTVEYKEKDKYIILQRYTESGSWYISGYVSDRTSGERLRGVSVYQPQLLVSTLTNDEGFFRLRMRERAEGLPLSISKMSYRDTTLLINPGLNEVDIAIAPEDYVLDTFVFNQKDKIKSTWYGRLFFSSKQEIQSLNLRKFFVEQPFQLSVIPGLGTHGKMSPQVGNEFSFNLFGGYNAYVDGVEVGGMFNIIKKDMRYAQVAGLFNIVGGKVTGAQVAGLYNQNFDSVTGAQVAGIASITEGLVSGSQVSGLVGFAGGGVSGAQISGIAGVAEQSDDGAQVSGVLSITEEKVDGVQVGGVLAVAGDSVIGTQVAGVANVAGGRVDGAQIAGIANLTGKGIRGVQIAGVINVATKVRGSQIGLINICDSISGCTIGLINIVAHGYHKLSVSTNEVFPLNASLKLGTQRFYSILGGGISLDPKSKAYGFGVGFGADWSLGRKFYLNPELTVQNIYQGDWEQINLLHRAQLSLHYKPLPYLSVFAGPAYYVYYNEQTTRTTDYRFIDPKKDFNASNLGGDVWGWVGWQFGINIF